MSLVYLWPNPKITAPIYDESGTVFPAGGAYVTLDDFYQNSIDVGVLLTYLAGGSTSGPVLPGGTGGASADAEYILKSANGTLPNGRVLNAGTGVTLDYSVPGQVTVAAPTAGGVINPGGAPQNVTKAAASAGISFAYSREDHKHDINTATPVSVVPGGTNQEGTSSSLARADHVHAAPLGVALTSSAPQSVGTANSVGSDSTAARADHVHNHGDQPGGTLHAIVTTTVPGFMSAADKVKLDGVTPGAGSGVALTNVAPQNISTIAATGTGTAAAREDHIHAHSNLPGGTLHALVTTTVPGFMAFADKVKLDALGTSMFLNVLDAGVVQGTLSSGARATNLANFNAAVASAISTNKILAVPPGSYEIAGSTGIILPANLRWLGSLKSVITQYTLNAPVVHVGSPLATANAPCNSVIMDGATLRYGGTATAGGHGLEIVGAFQCLFSNIDIGDIYATYSGRTSVPWAGVYWDPTVGTLPPFSNVFLNVRCKMWGWRGISMTRNDDGASGQSTGNVWINTYLSGGEGLGASSRQDLSAVSNSGMVVASGHTQLRFIQLNTEWCAVDTTFSVNAVHELEVNGWNIEGIELKRSFSYKCGFIAPYNTRIKVSGLTIYNCTALASNNVSQGSAFLIGPYSRVSFDTVHADGIQRTGSTMAVFDSIDGGGDDNVHISAGMLYMNIPGNTFDYFSTFTFATAGSGSLFGPLVDFHNSTPVVLGDTSETLYAYNTPGIYACAPSVARVKTMSRQFSAAETCRIPMGCSKEFRKTGGAGSLSVLNYNGTTLVTLTAVGVARVVFDGTDWSLLSVAGDAPGGGLQLASTFPADIANGAAVGGGTTAARSDHVHNHGTQVGGTTHPIVSGGGLAGFMSPADKNILDALQTYPYLTLANVSGLSAERSLALGQGLSGIDSGANGSVTIKKETLSADGRAVSLMGMPGNSVSSQWLQAGAYLQQFNITDFVNRDWWVELTPYLFPITQIAGTLDRVELLLQGSAHSSLPAIKPSMALVEVTSGATQTNKFTQTDPSASVSAYAASHLIIWTGSGITFTPSSRYYLVISGEASTNAQSGLVVYGLTLFFDFY